METLRFLLKNIECINNSKDSCKSIISPCAAYRISMIELYVSFISRLFGSYQVFTMT